MAQIIAKCRLTGHYAFMGIDASADELANAPEIFTRKFCPFCACEHSWLKRDAKLIDKQPLQRRSVQQSA
jgi:hypothetical protein